MAHLRNNKGFTLIEAVVASAILTIGMLGVGAMLRWSMENDRSSILSRTGDTVAMEVAEQLRGEIANSIIAVPNLANVRPNDPNFTYVGTNNPASGGCPGGINCIEQYGSYKGLNYIWRVDSGPGSTADPTGQGWARTWRLRVTVGWEDCPNSSGTGCTNMGGGRYNFRSTQIVTFLVPPTP